MTKLEIRSLDTDNRLGELIDLNKRIHVEDDPFWLNILKHNPESNNPACHKFLLADDEMVSGTSLIPHQLRWYGSTIESGEIGLVGTLEKHRRKGYATMLMNDYIETMHSDGIPFSFLWGIPRFYEEFHYYYAYPNHCTSYIILPKPVVADMKPARRIRAAEHNDFPLIKEIYDKYNSNLNGSMVRGVALWDWLFRLTRADGTDRWWVPDGDIDGYVFVSGDPPRVREIASLSSDSLRDLIPGIFQRYPMIENLEFYHHPKMPVGKWLYQWGAKIRSPEDIWKGTWGGMVRLNDPVGLLKGMKDKMNERLENSRFFNYTGTIAIRSELARLEIVINDGQVSVNRIDGEGHFHLPARVLTPICTGYKGFEKFRGELKDIPNGISDLLEVLFPHDLVYIYDLLYVDADYKLGGTKVE